MYTNNKLLSCFLLLFVCFCTKISIAQEEASSDAAEIAKKLSNPVAKMISFPLQNNTDLGIGDQKGSRNTLNIQPVIPIGLSDELNIIARVVLPFVAQYGAIAGTRSAGFGDAVASAFFSPAQAKDGLVWGAGPVFLLPVATDELSASKKFGIGPTIVIAQQTGSWTYGALANQIWSVAGDTSRPDVSQMYLQPFITHNWKSGAGIGVNAEINQYWKTKTTSVVIIPTITGVTKLGSQVVQLVVGPRIPIAAPEASKAEFGIRAAMTFVFSM
jgi:hypothetical protein